MVEHQFEPRVLMWDWTLSVLALSAGSAEMVLADCLLRVVYISSEAPFSFPWQGGISDLAMMDGGTCP